MAYTGNRQFKQDPRIIVGAEGIYFYDQNGRKIMDGLSGLWTCGLGHNRREIADAVSTQLRTLDYAPGFQYGQPKSFQLAERLRRLMPDDLDHVFFTGSGSEAADTSLKMARAYWRLKGQPLQDQAHRPHQGLPRGELWRYLGGRHRGKSQDVRSGCGRGSSAPHHDPRESLSARHARAGCPPRRRPARDDHAARRQQHRGSDCRTHGWLRRRPASTGGLPRASARNL